MAVLSDSKKVAYVIVDMETTGLSVDEDVPLEFGVGLYDINLRELAMNSWAIRPNGWREQLSRNEYVLNMHTENGLIADLVALPEQYYETDPSGRQMLQDYSMPMVNYRVWSWLTNECQLESGTFPLTGSSVGSLDKPFMRKYLPSVHDFFTYRSIDISSVKELCKLHNPKLYREMHEDPAFSDTNKAHRVRDDIRASAKELQYYIARFLQVQPDEFIADGQLELPILEV